MLRLFFALFIGKLIFFLSRNFKIGGGSAAPGLYALKIDPNLVEKLAAQIPQQVVITGTNGKTTTARLLSHLSEKQNLKIIRNSTGSNLERGIASTLISHTNLSGKVKDLDLAIWELDEAAFNKTIFKLRPQIIVFLNAFRDQLDRYGEVDSVVSKWQDVIEQIDWNPLIIVNADDQNTSRLKPLLGQSVVGFCVKGASVIGEGKKITHPKGLEILYKVSEIKPRELEGMDLKIEYPGAKESYFLPIPGFYHAYDFIAAFSAYYNLNLPLNNLQESLNDFAPAFGRVEKIMIGDVESYIFLIKNPAGATAVFETIQKVLKKEDRLLFALNDNFADGTDVSWIWDAEFEKLGIQGAEFRTFTSGTRAYDIALRLKYAGVDTKSIEINENLEETLKEAVTDHSGRLFILPTYTALLELQGILTKAGHKSEYWRDSK